MCSVRSTHAVAAAGQSRLSRAVEHQRDRGRAVGVATGVGLALLSASTIALELTNDAMPVIT